MTLEEQIQAIVDKRIAEKQEPLARRLEIAEAIIKDNGYLVDSAEASRLSGIKDTRTLKKRFTPVIDTDGRVKFNKAEIIEWRLAQSLPKAPELKIAS